MSRTNICHLLLLLSLVILSGCDRGAVANKEREYEVRGIVRSPISAEGSLVVEHEDVAGLMPSMTMPFKLQNVAEAADFQPGDGLAFTLVLGDGYSHITGLRKIDPATVKLPQPELRSAAATGVKRVKEGDVWPVFELVDQTGKEMGSGDFAGVFTLVDFIFTRCAVPDYCPLMTSHFLEIEKALAEDSAQGNVRLLSVSFDPMDTPDVLRQYAEAKDAGWTFATGKPEEIDKLTKAFGVRVEEEGGTLNHSLCTALIGPDGRVLHLWRGNKWKPQEVVEAIRAAQQTSQD